MTTIRMTYVGGLDEVHVWLPSGDTRTVARGATVDLLATDAEVLSPDEWQPATTTKKGS